MTDSMMPQAYVVHASADRLRLRVPSHRGDHGFFDRIREVLPKRGQFAPAAINATTGSILFKGKVAGIAQLDQYVSDRGLFSVTRRPEIQGTLISDATSPVGAVDRAVRQYSMGYVDTSGLLFMILVGVGVAELIRGNFRTPPWYVAFWYAFDLLTKSISNQRRPSAES